MRSAACDQETRLAQPYWCLAVSPALIGGWVGGGSDEDDDQPAVQWQTLGHGHHASSHRLTSADHGRRAMCSGLKAAEGPVKVS